MGADLLLSGMHACMHVCILTLISLLPQDPSIVSHPASILREQLSTTRETGNRPFSYIFISVITNTAATSLPLAEACRFFHTCRVGEKKLASPDICLPFYTLLTKNAHLFTIVKLLRVGEDGSEM